VRRLFCLPLALLLSGCGSCDLEIDEQPPPGSRCSSDDDCQGGLFTLSAPVCFERQCAPRCYQDEDCPPFGGAACERWMCDLGHCYLVQKDDETLPGCGPWDGGVWGDGGEVADTGVSDAGGTDAGELDAMALDAAASEPDAGPTRDATDDDRR